MLQYCRYCVNCIYGDSIYCDEKNTTITESYAKHPNACTQFEYCKMDVFNPDHIYQPRAKRILPLQITMDLSDD